MCNVEIKVEELVNIQTGRKIDMEKYENLPDNAMLKVKPELWVEWDFEENDKLGYDIYKMTQGMGKKAWWICRYFKHSFSMKVCHIVNGSYCPYCNDRNPKILKGFNDMWTTNPELASKLLNPEDGYKYTQSSGKRLDWKCPNCNSLIKNRYVYQIKEQGLSCPICSDGISIPEKIMFSVLKQLNLNFEYNLAKDWSEGKIYDFFIYHNNMRIIVETHGQQHSEKGFESIGGRTLEEEIENDLFKRKLALKNDIDIYIEIDCKHSDLEYIKNNILKSEMLHLFDLNKIDWNLARKESIKSFMIIASKMYSKGFSIKEISSVLKIDYHTVTNYLTKCAEIELCYYNPIFKRRVVQLTKNNEFVKTWDSITEAQNYTNISVSGITNCCKGIQKTSGGYRWFYLEEYEEYTRLGDIPKIKYEGNFKKVIQLDCDYIYIKEHKSIDDARISVGLKRGSGISECCNGRRETAGGYKWMYLEDYNQMISEQGNKLA